MTVADWFRVGNAVLSLVAFALLVILSHEVVMSRAPRALLFGVTLLVFGVLVGSAHLAIGAVGFGPQLPIIMAGLVVVNVGAGLVLRKEFQDRRQNGKVPR